MARHSKWSKIKRQKAVTDAKRGKTFTKHAKLIEVAARTGGDPNMNPFLRMMIDEARADNMPNDNIERAIKKGTGEAKEGLAIEEVMYEGFGPGGTALYIETLTDNRNRTITNLKIIIGRRGGTMGAAGSVGYLFQKKGIITLPIGSRSVEEVELIGIDAGAEDVKADEDTVEITTAPNQLMQVRKKLIDAGLTVSSAQLTYLPQTEIVLNSPEQAEQLMDLIEAIEEDDDVSCVYTNAIIPDELAG